MKIVRSRKLGDTIIIVADEAAASRLTNVHHMVYTEKEVSLLKDQPIGGGSVIRSRACSAAS